MAVRGLSMVGEIGVMSDDGYFESVCGIKCVQWVGLGENGEVLGQ